MLYMSIYTNIYICIYKHIYAIYEHIYKYIYKHIHMPYMYILIYICTIQINDINYIVYMWSLIPNKYLMKRIAIVIILHHGKGKHEIPLGQRVM